VVSNMRVSEMNCTNVVRVVHRMCNREGHKFVKPLDIEAVVKLESGPVEEPSHIKALLEDSEEDNQEKKDNTNKEETKEDVKEESIPKLEQNPEVTIENKPPSPPAEVIHQPPTEGQGLLQESTPALTPTQVPSNPEVYPSPAYPPAPDAQQANYYQGAYPGYQQEEVKDYRTDTRQRDYHTDAAYPTHDQYDDRRRSRVDYDDPASRGYHNRERTPEQPRTTSYARDDNSIKYIKVSYLPPNCDKNKIIDFFGSIPIAYANIALVFDQTGRFCQEAILALNSLNDQVEALSQSGRYIFNYQVVVQEGDAREWERAQQSQKVFFSRDDKILVRMRGLPFTVKKEEILMFFNGYDVVPDSVIIGEMSNGKKTGEGVILFKNEEEAARAVNEKNGDNLGKRWIELYLHPYSHFHNFYQAQNHEEYVYLHKYITDENKQRTLRVRGLPYSCTKKDMVTFFRDFAVTNNDIVFEIKEGRPTGKALVFMIDANTAVRAIQALDKEYIGKRYVELEQVSNLHHSL